MRLLKLLPRAVRSRAFVAYGIATRAMTLGVRALVTDGERVLLVRHTYVQGWHIPGGGVERDETFEAALAKELAEETHVRPTAEPVLHGLYRNTAYSRLDHVALYVVREFEEDGPFVPTHEIAECRFFALDAMPDTLHPGSARRIGEILRGEPRVDYW